MIRMKKGFVVLLISIISCSTFGQVKFGMKGGGSLCNTYKLVNEDYEYHRLGWYAGGLAQIPLSAAIFLQPEILFSSKGFRYPFYIPRGDKAAVVLNYISVPLIAQYKLFNRFLIGIGPDISYLVSAKNKYPTNEIVDVTDQYPIKFDFGIDANVSFQIIHALSVDARYYYGFRTYYYTDVNGVRVGESRGANRAFQIGISYVFN